MILRSAYGLDATLGGWLLHSRDEVIDTQTDKTLAVVTCTRTGSR